MEEIKFDNEARELLLEGVNDLNNAVSKTMGPNGSTVIIPSDKEHGKYIVTKDGVSVAKAIKFKNPYKNIGAQLIKQAAEKEVLKEQQEMEGRMKGSKQMSVFEEGLDIN